MVVTNHGHDKMKERISLPIKAHEKLAKRALEKGVKHSEVSGSLKRYMDSIYLSHGKANNMRIFGEYIYLFHNDILITVFAIPKKYLGTVKKVKEGRVKNEMPNREEC